MQALFYLDSTDGEPEEALSLFRKNFSPEEDLLSFFETLVNGVIAHQAEIDRIISTNSKNWKLSRMPSVDRNTMRIAVYELLYCQDIPAKVSINEAIDIGKKYGAPDSGAFINGILDTIFLNDIEKGKDGK